MVKRWTRDPNVAGGYSRQERVENFFSRVSFCAAHPYYHSGMQEKTVILPEVQVAAYS